MTRGTLALIASGILTLPVCATAQEQISLDEYFRGTTLEGRISANPTANVPVTNLPAPNLPAPAAPQSFNQQPQTQFQSATAPYPTPQTATRSAPGFGQPASNTRTQPMFSAPQMASAPAASIPPISRQSSDPSQIDPITGLPLSMTSLGMSRATPTNSAFGPGPVTPSMLPGGLGPTNFGTAPNAAMPNGQITPLSIPGWNAFPTQQMQPSASGVRIGHSGPIAFDGLIEAVDPSSPIATLPLTSAPVPTLALNGGVPLPPLPEEISLPLNRDTTELHDFGEVTPDLLDHLQRESNDQPLEDLCVSRRGYVVLEHWGYHAAALAGRRDLLGITTVQGNFTVSFPQLIDGLTVRPQFGFHELSGPLKTDLPSQLFDVMVEGGWTQSLSDRIAVRVAGTVGLYTDFDQSHLSDAVRVSGLALGTFELNEDLQLALGAAYVNLANRKVLPIAGVVITPNDDVRLELLYPEGKLAWRIDPGRDHERWLYVGGSFFGRTWNINRSSGANDDVTYSDWRVGLGIESHLQTRAVWYLEVGAALGRQLEYESHVGDYDPGSTGYLRGGFYY